MSIFDWAEREKGLTLAALAEHLGYSLRHVYRLRSGESPVTPSFVARAVMTFGDQVRPLFLDSVTNDNSHVVRKKSMGLPHE